MIGLAISITINIVLLILVIILFFRRCKKCGKDKEIGWVFSKYCERCEKNGVDKSKEKEKKRKIEKEKEICEL